MVRPPHHIFPTSLYMFQSPGHCQKMSNMYDSVCSLFCCGHVFRESIWQCLLSWKISIKQAQIAISAFLPPMRRPEYHVQADKANGLPKQMSHIWYFMHTEAYTLFTISFEYQASLVLAITFHWKQWARMRAQQKKMSPHEGSTNKQNWALMKAQHFKTQTSRRHRKTSTN